MKTKSEQRLKRKKRIRKKIFGTSQRPRFSVYRSERYVYAQLIDDLNGRTLVAANSLDQGGKNASNKLAAEKVGTLIAQKAKAQNIKGVTFDRNGFLYHGVVKSLATAARKGGLEF